MGRQQRLHKDRGAGDGHEKTEPTEAATVRAVPTIPGHPKVGEGEEQQERGALDRVQVCTRAECKIQGDQKRERADENVNDTDLFVTDLPQDPKPIAEQNSADPKKSQSRKHAVLRRPVIARMKQIKVLLGATPVAPSSSSVSAGLGHTDPRRDRVLWARGIRKDIEVENFRRNGERAAGVRDVDDAADAAFTRRGAEDHVGLFAGIAELLEIFDGVQTGTPVRDVSVQIMLLARHLVYRDALKNQVFREPRLDRTRLEDGIGDGVLFYAVFDQIDTDINPAGHFDRATESDFAVALRPVNVAHREAAALHIDWEVDARAARQVLDVAVAAMLAWRHRPPCLLGRVLRLLSSHLPHQRRIGVRRCQQGWNAIWIGGEQLGFALVGAFEKLAIGQAPDQPLVDHAGPAHARYMARTRIDPVEVPAGLARLRIVVDQETAAVFPGEDSGESPRRVRQITDIKQANDQEIAGLGTFDAKRTA